MNVFESPAVGRRADQARWVLLVVFLILCGAFFRLQILEHERFALTSAKHRLRRLPLPAPRGMITDRHGAPIAMNIPGYSIKLLAQDHGRREEVRDSLRAVLARMQTLVPDEAIDVEGVLTRWSGARFRPVVVFPSGRDSTVAILEEHRAILPGLLIEQEPRRAYPAGPAAAHLIGYLGEVSEREVTAGRFPGVERGEQVGKDGLEAEYDSLLRGARGARYVEVTAQNHVVRNPQGVDLVLPRSGTTLRTTIDLPLQLFIDSLWQATLPGKAGAMLAMTPGGEILAYASFPSFDPNAFIARSDPAAVTDAFTNPRQPMFNRAIAGRYPPASPWKLVTAIMGIKRGLVTMDTRMPIPCTGGYRFGNRTYGCWDKAGHGIQTLAEAIAHSCDVYFYQLGLRLGRDAILQDGEAMGFKTTSGADLAREVASDYPTLEDYVKRRGGWYGNGEILNLSIGQGMNRQTLINMTSFYAALAHDGVKRAPYLVAPVAGAPQWDYGLTPSQLDGVREALKLVVTSGTAAASGGRDLRVAGKTGTGQVTGQENLAWFIGFAPWEAPQIVVGIVVEEGLHGSSVVGQVVKAIAQFLGHPTGAVVVPVADERPPVLPDSILPDSVIPDTLGRGVRP